MSDRVMSTAIEGGAAESRILEWPKQQGNLEPQVYCAYNPVREKFLCSFIELAETASVKLRDELNALSEGTNRGLWLAPFRGIASNKLRSPIDLVFLDRNNCVLAIAKSFPDSQPSSSEWPASSAIALAAGSIASSGTLAGDQLILCSPQKMKRRIFDSRLELNQRELEPFSYESSSALDSVPAPLGPMVLVTSWDQLPTLPRRGQATAEPESGKFSPASTAESAAKPRNGESSSNGKNWLFCLLAAQRKEKRKSARESLPWIAAYFYDEGTPAPATICNISSLGMYVNTSERWTPGTTIRVTLSDWRLPSLDRTVTLKAMAVRSDEKGVGLRFVFEKQRHDGASKADEGQPTDITRSELKEFLEQYKGVGRSHAGRKKMFR